VGGSGVLRGVGQRLGHNVVGRDLDRLGEPGLRRGVEFDGDRRAAGQRS
jgi:hypothetical protein